MKENRSTIEIPETPVGWYELRVERETVRTLRVRTGILAGGGRSTGGSQGNGATVQIASA